jgi:flagellar export protein FliJ
MNIKQLRLVIRLAEEQRDAATAQLASGKAQWQVAQDQLEQLQRYQGQYVVQAKQEAQLGISVQALFEGRRFIAELDDLIMKQQQNVEQQASVLQSLTEQWMDAARYVQALEQLETLQLAERQREEDRRDQQLADDQYAIRNFSPDYSTA